MSIKATQLASIDSGLGNLEEIKDEDDDELDEKLFADADDYESNALHHNYDMINLRLRPDSESENPFRAVCIDQLTRYYKKIGDTESNP